MINLEDKESQSWDHYSQTDQLPFLELPLSKKFRIGLKVLKNSLPIILTFEAPMITGIINVYFLRHYHSEALIGGYGIGLEWSHIFLLSISISLNQGLNILVAAAHGSKHYSLCSVYLQRGLLILLIFLVPCFIIMYFSTEIMTTIGIDETLAGYAGELTRKFIPSMLLYSIFDLLKAFVSAHKVFYPIFFIHLFTLAMHPFWAWLFISHYNLGITGVAYARFCEETINLSVLFVYVLMSSNFKETFQGWQQDTFDLRLMWSQVKFTLGLASINFLEYFYFEFMNLLGGTFGTRDAVANIAVHETSAIGFIFSLGVSLTLMVYISNSLGEGHPNKAKNYGIIGYILSAFFGGALMIIIGIFKIPWADFWTESEDIKKYLLEIMTLYMWFILPGDAINHGSLAILKGCGKQLASSMGLLISFYVLSLPLGLYMAYVENLKVLGLWIAHVIAIFALMLFYLVRVGILDFNKIVIETRRRIEEHKGSMIQEK